MADARPLTFKAELFVETLLADEQLDATRAYEAVYKCTHKAAQTGASKLMADPRIIQRVEARKAERMKAAGLSAAEILAELRNVTTADPRDLMELRRGACRYCHGEGFRFHRTPAEYRRDMDSYIAEQEALARKGGAAGEKADVLGLLFKVEGGIGYNRTREPHPDCPECFGEGVAYSFPKDSRTVSPAAARLFVGVKETKDGLEIKTRNVDKSVELMMRHAGMLSEKAPSEGDADARAAEIRELVTALGATVGGPG